METTLIVLCVLVIVLILLWHQGYIDMQRIRQYTKTEEEGMDVRSLARPIVGQYTTSARVSGRQWT